MSVLNKKLVIATLLSFTLLGGCSSAGIKSGEATNNQKAVAPAEQSAATPKVKTYTAEEQAAITAKKLAEAQAKAKAEAAQVKKREQAALRDVRTFYFDFDKSDLKPASRMPLLAHAAYLVANPSMKIQLNGYTDDRGTQEYNLALGERRAKAVERFLVINGVSRSQINVTSYGKLNPVATGNNDAAWAKNRRVELLYK